MSPAHPAPSSGFTRYARFLPIAAAGLLTILGFSSLAHAQKQTQGKKKAPAAPAPAPVPFRVGERLEYAAQWNHFVTAAVVRMQVTDQREFFGEQAWHLQAFATTIDPVRRLFTLDDQFDSYTDTITLESHQYESYIREQTRNEDLVVPMATRSQPGRANRRVYVVFPDTTDPVGLIYRLRTVDWKKDSEARLRVFDGRKYYDVEARRELTGVRVAVPGGSFTVTRIPLRILQDGTELPNLKLAISLSEDAARIPVLFEAEASIGTVRAELTSRGP
jgi:Protein of unknown function (DUF3108)